MQKRKKYKWKDPWMMTEWCNWVADGIAGSARKMAEKEEKEWVAQVDKWNAEVDRRERLGGITKEVAKPVRARAVLLMPAWKLANSMQWVLCWEDLEVTGPTATWVRETLQNAYSTDYLRKQSAGLFRSHVPHDTVDCDDLLGKSFQLDGEEWEVIEADASSGLVKYARGSVNEKTIWRRRSHRRKWKRLPRRRCAAGLRIGGGDCCGGWMRS